MIEENVTFYSEGHKLRGTLYFPDASIEARPRPAIVVNSGYQGFNTFYPRMFAQQLVKDGYICLGFDYRGMASSEGDAGRVLIDEQVQDVRNAITFTQTQERVDNDSIALIGWGMGAANVILAADRSTDVAAVAALNGFYDGERWLKSVHSHERWQEILDDIHSDRVNRVLHGESQLKDTFVHYPLDAATRGYVEAELAQVPGFGDQTRVQFTESIVDLKTEHIVSNLSPIPLFVGHGRHNVLHPYQEAEALFQAASPPKTLYRIEGQHNDFMFSEHPEFLSLCDQLRGFLKDAFQAKVSPQRVVSE